MRAVASGIEEVVEEKATTIDRNKLPLVARHNLVKCLDFLLSANHNASNRETSRVCHFAD